MSAILQISAGTGPVEVRRFVALLAEYWAARCEERGASVVEVVVFGQEAAPASVEIHLLATPACIQGIEGTHALVARSENRGKKARKRWYAGACLREGAGALVPGSTEVRREDVTITAMRAAGPGGQKVNKTSSAVRVHHAASGVTVRAASERSQRDNISAALRRIAEIVAARANERAAQDKAGRRIAHYRVERGRPVYTYELDRSGGLTLCEETCSK